jgi:hypothetical protein
LNGKEDAIDESAVRSVSKGAELVRSRRSSVMKLHRQPQKKAIVKLLTEVEEGV